MNGAAPGPAEDVRAREIAGWAMFDFANSAYTTVVITAVYSAFFVSAIVPAEAAARDSYWALAMVGPSVLTLGLAPLVGAACDASGHKKRWLAAASALCVGGTASLVFVGPGDVWLGVCLLVVATLGFNLTETFCASFLPDLAKPRDMARISGIGWATGYAGGLASLIVVSQLFIVADEASQYAEWVRQNRLAMPLTALFFAVAALPMFVFVRERSRAATGGAPGLAALFRAGVNQLGEGWSAVRADRVLVGFFGAFVVYMAGLQAVIKFVGIYARQEVMLSDGQMALLFLILQVSAAAGAFAFGVLESRMGARATLLLTLGGWVVATLAIALIGPLSAILGVTPQLAFFGVAVLAGSGLGSVQSSSRAVVGMLAPAGRVAQVFGLWGVCMHIANILGMSFGPAADVLGSRRVAMFVIVGFFALGAALLMRVDLRSRTQRAV